MDVTAQTHDDDGDKSSRGRNSSTPPLAVC